MHSYQANSVVTASASRSFQNLVDACYNYKHVLWLANVGQEQDGKVPPHFVNVKHVFAFSSCNKGLEQGGYRFGHFTYEMKNQLENLRSKNLKRFNFEDRQFFKPQVMAQVNGENEVTFNGKEVLDLQATRTQKPVPRRPISLKPTLSKDQYVGIVERIKEHIQLGDVYELNFCMDHVTDNVDLDPIETFSRLSAESESPFCAYYRMEDLHILCLSPERFLAKRGNILFSQPMKGTSAKGDERLNTDLKERAENIMITDLVRNDLSKSAEKGTVKVDELCGVYPFGSVNQMISTVSCVLDSQVTSEQAILNAFPMGSMTGAPKVRAMELIDKYEQFGRGLYSGSIGYFAPNGDFDFNVVIRSLIYDAKSKKLSCPTGSAITILSDPEKEYDECMLKAQWIKDKLNGN